MRKFYIISILLIFFSFFLIFSSLAQEYPSKPIQGVISLSAGGTMDVIVRGMAPFMEDYLGQPLVLTNEAGANGTVAVAHVAASKPDGYTFGWCNMPTINIHYQMRDLPYTPDDFEYVGSPMPYEYAVVVRPDEPWKENWESFIQYAKDHPNMVTYGVPGIGSTNHLTMAYIGMKENISWNAVPFKGDSEAVAAVLGGHVDCAETATIPMLSPTLAGQLKALVVGSKRRLDFVPDISTLEEKGYGFFQFSCIGMILPKNTPENIRQKLESAIEFAVNQDEVQEMAKNVWQVRLDFKNGEEYKELLLEYGTFWGGVLKELGMLKDQ
ncbi:MAG: tripartite tricarboxylate transporter substrate binding protein [Atribacterota bacterium]|nr:tripartite tricarboxylate transporter substrate binding protein [Atribacterota bacterium]MDD4895804.1 tripartite tricarboxylate transporter substrate binding protein [Atribacterota bacterium]MDD5637449.1 tripartite tricarboxylate transporter substrate binding protein [Atribacterota bacterium]